MENSMTARIEKGARLSGSPANSPRIVPGRTSPAKSEEGKMEEGLESIHKQHDPGMRTTDFFDDTSDTASDPARSVRFSHSAEIGDSQDWRLSSTSAPKVSSNLGGPSSTVVAQYRDASSKRPSKESGMHPFLRLTSGYGTHHVGPHVFENMKSSHADSADGLSAVQSRQLYPQTSDAGKFVQHGLSPRASAVLDEKPLETSLNPKNDRILSAHAITMQALLRDDSLGHDIMSPLTEEPQTMHLFASLGDRLEEKSSALNAHGRKRSRSAPSRKRVSFVPPPINIHSPKRTLPEDIVRTPYPFFKHKDPAILEQDAALKSSPTHSSQDSINLSNRNNGFDITNDATDCVLTLSIRRANFSRSPPRVSRLVIPSAAHDFRSVRNSTINIREKHFDGLGFDDAELFRRMREEYAKLAGPWRFLSARVLKRVTVVAGDEVCSVTSGSRTSNQWHNCTCGSSASYRAYRHMPSLRSPRLVAHAGLSDTFSESKLLLHLRSRKLGKARYAWVHWARRLGSCPARPGSSYEPFEPHRPAPAPPLPARHPDRRHRPSWPLTDQRSSGNGVNPHSGPRDSGVEVEEEQQQLERETEQHEPKGLEFVPGWSVGKIVGVVGMVMVLAVAAAVLWILLGLPIKDLGTLPGYGDTGFRGAGGRVGTGCAFGVLVLVVGWTGAAGWIWLSWVIM